MFQPFLSTQGLSRRLGLAALCSLAVVGAPGVSFAAACFESPAALASSEVADFQSNPDVILASNTSGGGDLARAVRFMVGTESDTVSALIKLAESASPEQIASIGAGLGQAASICELEYPEISLQIQEAVAASGLPALVSAFNSAVGGEVTAALGDTEGGDQGGDGDGGDGGDTGGDTSGTTGSAIGGTASTGGGGGGGGGSSDGDSESVDSTSFSLSSLGTTNSFSTTVSEN